MLALLLLNGCASPPVEAGCDALAPQGWTPEWTTTPRATGADLAWVAGEAGRIESGPTLSCAALDCLTVHGTAESGLRLNREVEYTLSTTIGATGGEAHLVLLQETYSSGELEIGRIDVPAGPPTPVSLAFHLPVAGPDVRLRISAAPGGETTVTGLTLTSPTWAAVDLPTSPADPLQLGFLIHVEPDSAYSHDAVVWRASADILAALSQTFAAHGAALTIQADPEFLGGAARWAPGWAQDRLAEGASFSAHFHSTDDSAEAFVHDAGDARDVLLALGLDATDLNGGFPSGAWSGAADLGYRSLSAYKDRYTQDGLPLGFTVPWRPPEGADSDDVDAFMSDDPAGPLVYLPGHTGTEADHARLLTFTTPILAQALAHIVPDAPNAWYFLDHLESYGPGTADGRVAYVTDGGLDADLAGVDALLTTLTDPLVRQGAVRYATPQHMRAAYDQFEARCR